MIHALYFDGKSSQQHAVLIRLEPPSQIVVTGESVQFSCPSAAVQVLPRIGNTRRLLYFPGGAQCETGDNDAVDALFSGVIAAPPGQWLHRLESRWRWALGALALTAAIGWVGVSYGIPALAKQIAFHMPNETQRLIGAQTLGGMDQVVFEPTRLKQLRQAQVKALFQNMLYGLDGAGAYRIELRSSKQLGANAIALPSGIVVVTDGLVELAASDYELRAVLAHELGHLRQRHGLRQWLQSSATALVAMVVWGDISGGTAFVSAMPAMLLQLKYSRDFEIEADDFALDYLKRNKIPVQALADILLRMEKQQGVPGNVASYLSTHPATQERIERAHAWK